MFLSDVLFPEALELFVRHLGFGFIHHAVVSIAGNVGPDKISNSLMPALLDGILQDSPAAFMDSVRERFAVVQPIAASASRRAVARPRRDRGRCGAGRR